MNVVLSKIFKSYGVIIVLIISAPHISFAQKKQISLEDIWEKRTFSAKSVPGFNFMNDGEHYTVLESNKLIKKNITNDNVQTALVDFAMITSDPKITNVDSYSFSSDESKILISQNDEKIYRHSSKGEYYSYDFTTSSLVRIFPKGKIMYPTFNPSADKVAFVYDNNIYIQDLKTNKVSQVTTDGSNNHIINGASDWVYEEEFGLLRCFEWSPNGDKIAYIKTNETDVREYTMDYYYDEAYPRAYSFKYPKVGEKNASLSIWMYDINSKETSQVNTGIDPSMDSYYPRIKWTNSNDNLCITWMNRWQNHLKLILYSSRSLTSSIILEEKNKYYIDLHDNLTFLKNGKEFLWTSEQDGYNHIYKYNMSGKLVQQISNGTNELTEFYGLNAAENKIYYQRSENNGLDRKIYSMDINGKNIKCLDDRSGNHSVQMSKGAKYFIHTYSTLQRLPQYQIIDADSKIIKRLEDNSFLSNKMQEYNLSNVDLTSIKNKNGDALNAILIKPNDFDTAKKYPVFMFLYGGPGSQQVMNRWNSFGNYWWFQMLAQKGYIICIVDNRGTGGRGEEFKKMTYLQMGKYETEDQIDAAKYLGSLRYVDASRIGIYGWSYGGYMSSLCLLKGNDVFKAAIAVAPVTNWKWYDSVYTERYMRDTKENKAGYDDNSPVNFADRLKGNFLLVHGIADDNVHFQNSVEMTNALIKNKKQFDLMVYPNRNHSIFGDNARMHLFTKMTNFVLEKI